MTGDDGNRLARYLKNWQDEVDSAAEYRAIAAAEPDSRLAKVYADLVAAGAGPGAGHHRAEGRGRPERLRQAAGDRRHPHAGPGPLARERFVGMVLGAALGAIGASYFGPHVLVVGTCVVILGLLRAVAHVDLTAFRFGGVTLAIVLPVPGTGPAWQLAFHRFTEVSMELGWR